MKAKLYINAQKKADNFVFKGDDFVYRFKFNSLTKSEKLTITFYKFFKINTND